MALQDKGFIQYNFENAQAFQSSLDKALSKISDLRFPLNLIADDFYKSEKAIFQLKSPGGYKDLKPKTKIQKQKKFGFIYPILKRTGILERSITRKGAPGNITIITKTTLTVGTSVPYGIFHNSDKPRKKIPQRKFVFIGPESRAFNAKDRGKGGGRLTRWTNILERFVFEAIKKS